MEDEDQRRRKGKAKWSEYDEGQSSQARNTRQRTEGADGGGGGGGGGFVAGASGPPGQSRGGGNRSEGTSGPLQIPGMSARAQDAPRYSYGLYGPQWRELPPPLVWQNCPMCSGPCSNNVCTICGMTYGAASGPSPAAGPLSGQLHIGGGDARAGGLAGYLNPAPFNQGRPHVPPRQDVRGGRGGDSRSWLLAETNAARKERIRKLAGAAAQKKRMRKLVVTYGQDQSAVPGSGHHPQHQLPVQNQPASTPLHIGDQREEFRRQLLQLAYQDRQGHSAVPVSGHHRQHQLPVQNQPAPAPLQIGAGSQRFAPADHQPQQSHNIQSFGAAPIQRQPQQDDRFPFSREFLENPPDPYLLSQYQLALQNKSAAPLHIGQAGSQGFAPVANQQQSHNIQDFGLQPQQLKPIPFPPELRPQPPHFNPSPGHGYGMCPTCGLVPASPRMNPSRHGCICTDCYLNGGMKCEVCGRRRFL